MSIVTRPATTEYRDNFEATFGAKSQPEPSPLSRPPTGATDGRVVAGRTRDSRRDPGGRGDGRPTGGSLKLSSFSAERKTRSLISSTGLVNVGIKRLQAARSLRFPASLSARHTPMTHTCHAHGCTRVVPPRMFACEHHWAALRPALRIRDLAGISRRRRRSTKTPRCGT